MSKLIEKYTAIMIRQSQKNILKKDEDERFFFRATTRFA